MTKWLKILSLRKGSPLRRARKRLARRLWTRVARFNRSRSQSLFIGVTGSSGKSTTVALLAHILEAHGTVRSQVFRNAIGPLLRTMQRAPREDYVVVETAVAAQGDMGPIAGLLRPDVAIVTLVGLEHYSAFRSREAVAAEKGRLVEAVGPGGLVLLNADDDQVMPMAGRTSGRVVTFGHDNEADYRVVSATSAYPEPLTLAMVWSGGAMTLRTQFIGEHFWLSTVAAAAAAIELGVPLATIVDRVASFEGTTLRCQPYPTAGGPTFLLDTAKAPYGTLDLAFKTLGDAAVPFKRVVLGQISDYPGASRPKYASAYRRARAVADQVVFVGENSHRSRAGAEDVESGRFTGFFDPKQASEYVNKTARSDELILVKGSANLHLERIALAWDHDVKCWQTYCGKAASCFGCGLYEHPFERHGAVRRAQRARRVVEALKFWKRGAETAKPPARRV